MQDGEEEGSRLLPESPSSSFKDPEEEREERFKVLALQSCLAVVVALVCYGAVSGGLVASAQSLGEWVKHFNVLFLSIVMLFVLCVCDAAGIPTSLICTASGYIFAKKIPGPRGFALSFCVSYIGCVSGSLVAFVLGKSVLRRWAAEQIKGNRLMTAISLAIMKNEFRINVLVRLSPLPDLIINYGLACTRTSVTAFVFGSLGLIPWLVLDTYAGSTLSDLSEIGKTTRGAPATCSAAHHGAW